VIFTVSVHPEALLPITVYVAVNGGEAITVDPVELLSEDEGVHVYVEAPDAIMVSDPPEQMLPDDEAVILMLGEGLIDIFTLSFPAHPLPLIPVTTYVIAVVGVAITTAPVVALNPVDGLHV
jgi:hypothetical protein